MKKLLMIGSILIMGITAFGVDVELKPDGPGPDPAPKYEGEVKMTVGARGIATDGTPNGKLIVTPLTNGGNDGNSLEFSFNDLIIGRTEKIAATFKAEVINDKGEFATLTDKITVELERNTISDNGSSIVTPSGNKITGIELYKTGTQNKLGTLAYEITSNRLNKSDKVLEVEVLSTVAIDKDTQHTGNFMDESAKIRVNVEGLTGSGIWD